MSKIPFLRKRGLVKPPPYEFSLISRSADLGTGNSQGVAYDGTYYYYTADNSIYKYTRSGSTYTLVTSRDCSGDNPTAKTQINGMHYYNGSLWIGANNFAIPFPDPHLGWILEYNPSTLTLINAYSVKNHVSEGGAWKDVGNGDEFWAVYSDWDYVSRYKIVGSVWTHQADYQLPLVEGQTHIASVRGLYQGATWYNDILIVQTHAVNPDTETHFYKWSGASFRPIEAIPSLGDNVGQGLHWETEGSVMLFAERDPGGAGQTIIRANFIIN